MSESLFYSFTDSVWRHWGCITKKIIENMKKSFEDASELDGYEELKAEDQARVTKAWEDGEVADEDIPPSARKPEGEDGAEEKPKKAAKKAPAKKKAAEDGKDEEVAEKPKKKAAAPKVRSCHILSFFQVITVCSEEGRTCK